MSCRPGLAQRLLGKHTPGSSGMTMWLTIQTLRTLSSERLARTECRQPTPLVTPARRLQRQLAGRAAQLHKDPARQALSGPGLEGRFGAVVAVVRTVDGPDDGAVLAPAMCGHRRDDRPEVLATVLLTLRRKVQQHAQTLERQTAQGQAREHSDELVGGRETRGSGRERKTDQSRPRKAYANDQLHPPAWGSQARARSRSPWRRRRIQERTSTRRRSRAELSCCRAVLLGRARPALYANDRGDGPHV